MQQRQHQYAALRLRLPAPATCVKSCCGCTTGYIYHAFAYPAGDDVCQPVRQFDLQPGISRQGICEGQGALLPGKPLEQVCVESATLLLSNTFVGPMLSPGHLLLHNPLQITRHPISGALVHVIGSIPWAGTCNAKLQTNSLHSTCCLLLLCPTRLWWYIACAHCLCMAGCWKSLWSTGRLSLWQQILIRSWQASG